MMPTRIALLLLIIFLLPQFSNASSCHVRAQSHKCTNGTLISDNGCLAECSNTDSAVCKALDVTYDVGSQCSWVNSECNCISNPQPTGGCEIGPQSFKCSNGTVLSDSGCSIKCEDGKTPSCENSQLYDSGNQCSLGPSRCECN